jgi:hypothetical protein
MAFARQVAGVFNTEDVEGTETKRRCELRRVNMVDDSMNGLIHQVRLRISIIRMECSVRMISRLGGLAFV